MIHAPVGVGSCSTNRLSSGQADAPERNRSDTPATELAGVHSKNLYKVNLKF